MSNLTNSPTATLFLASSAASSTLTNNLGFTWNNINLRNLLGDMYDKYDLFNIALVQAASGVGASNIGASLDDLNVQLVMSGLPWVNQTYNSTTMTNKSSAIIGIFTFARSATANQLYYANNALTFSKNQLSANISISYLNMATGNAPSPVAAYPGVNFLFSIIGIPKPNEGAIITENRLKI